ncbi:hypothetical protein SmJEL517_g01171 [Synchytrium microbalum]|uniref:F-box domain-containing protein n=1 Tax=Synchytrium microbalum TaxID=1806994 RepID=A0A507CF34_9FUNG|nr:uncharacterized protein SmJEL517_g01171 [Synchytrium microbalum]TPX36606.1 hypothetical protein SmJEL517_g01171 [Synchytrium microbalum]
MKNELQNLKEEEEATHLSPLPTPKPYDIFKGLPDELIGAIFIRTQHPLNLSSCSRRLYRISRDERLRAQWLLLHPTTLFYHHPIPACITLRSIPSTPTTFFPLAIMSSQQTLKLFIQYCNQCQRQTHFDRVAIAVVWKFAIEKCYEDVIIAILNGVRTKDVINTRDFLCWFFVRPYGERPFQLATIKVVRDACNGETLNANEIEVVIRDGQADAAVMLLRFMGVNEWYTFIVERAFHLRRMDTVTLLMDFWDVKKGGDARIDRLRMGFEALNT